MVKELKRFPIKHILNAIFSEHFKVNTDEICEKYDVPLKDLEYFIGSLLQIADFRKQLGSIPNYSA